MDQESMLQDNNTVSRRFRDDDEANANVGGTLLTLVITYVVLLFVGFLLFNSLAPDTNDICNDPTNFTADECSDAQDARGFFFTMLIIAGVVILLVMIGIGIRAANFVGGSGGGGGGRSRRRR